MQLKYAIETLLLMMDMNSSDEVSTSKQSHHQPPQRQISFEV